MKKNMRNILALVVLAASFASCEKDDKLSSVSNLTGGEQVVRNEVDDYLDAKFKIPYNIDVDYRWDRNKYGPGLDVLRNLFPAKLSSVQPAMEMVDKVWLQSYAEVAGAEFLKEIRPGKLLLAGGYAYNDDGTRTLGLASGGVQVTLYETDFLQTSIESASQFIHTIQHEYIHIINQKQEFDELKYGDRNKGNYTPQWYELHSALKDDRGNPLKDAHGKPWNIDTYGNILGFVTGYSRSNTFEDFAEVASYLLANTPEDFEAMLDNIDMYDAMTPTERAKYGLTSEVYQTGGVDRILYKVEFVKDYFISHFGIEFDELIKVANKNAADSPMLNKGMSTRSTFGIQSKSIDNTTNVRYCQHHATGQQSNNKGL